MIFRQLFDPESSTYTYIVGDEATGEAVLIDPVLEQVDRDLAELEALGLRLVYTLETHVHADHVTGASALRERTGSQSVVHEEGGASCANVPVHHGQIIAVGGLRFEARHVPGHTAGDIAWVIGDRAFTGDSLLIGGCGRTDFQQGDPGRLYDSIHSQLFTLPDDTLVFPGHDYKGQTQSTIGREKAENARLGGGRSREAFIDIMNNLNLPPPKHLARALPANLACGRVDL